VWDTQTRVHANSLTYIHIGCFTHIRTQLSAGLQHLHSLQHRRVLPGQRVTVQPVPARHVPIQHGQVPVHQMPPWKIPRHGRPSAVHRLPCGSQHQRPRRNGHRHVPATVRARLLLSQRTELRRGMHQLFRGNAVGASRGFDNVRALRCGDVCAGGIRRVLSVPERYVFWFLCLCVLVCGVQYLLSWMFLLAYISYVAMYFLC
jgi:hypothetical protein